MSLEGQIVNLELEKRSVLFIKGETVSFLLLSFVLRYAAWFRILFLQLMYVNELFSNICKSIVQEELPTLEPFTRQQINK